MLTHTTFEQHVESALVGGLVCGLKTAGEAHDNYLKHWDCFFSVDPKDREHNRMMFAKLHQYFTERVSKSVEDALREINKDPERLIDEFNKELDAANSKLAEAAASADF
jgi:hypothetical protein